jgi:hypothetical protein
MPMFVVSGTAYGRNPEEWDDNYVEEVNAFCEEEARTTFMNVVSSYGYLENRRLEIDKVFGPYGPFTVSNAIALHDSLIL